MWLKPLQLLLLGWCCVAASCLRTKDGNATNIVCYYEMQKPGQVDQLQPELIDPSLCTHIILAFASIVDNQLKPRYPYETETYQKIMNLKLKQPTLKVILAAGGGNSDVDFSKMVHTQESRSSFIKQALPMLHQYGFDGFDLDWEFPGWFQGDPNDKALFVAFLKEFRAAADSLWNSSANPFLLSVDVASIPPMADVSYDVPEMAKYVDFVNIMCYDYHFYIWYNPFTGHNSPLFNRSIEAGFSGKLNLAWSANYWVSKGMPKSKINVGIPTYGHTYKLLVPSWNGFDAPASNAGMFGGWITYPLVCVFLKNGGFEVFDGESQAPYAYLNNDWVAYDNIMSIAAKSKWIKANNFSGIMTFDLNCDDWAGTCDRKTTFPLHRTIQKVFTSTLTN